MPRALRHKRTPIVSLPPDFKTGVSVSISVTVRVARLASSVYTVKRSEQSRTQSVPERGRSTTVGWCTTRRLRFTPPPPPPPHPTPTPTGQAYKTAMLVTSYSSSISLRGIGCAVCLSSRRSGGGGHEGTNNDAPPAASLTLESFDFVSLHSPYNKLVQKGLARCDGDGGQASPRACAL